MQHHRKHRRMSLRKSIRNAVVFVIAVGLLLVGIREISSRLEPRRGDPRGSLDGRFTPSATSRQYKGSRWYYRDQDLTNILIMGIDWEEDRSQSASWRYAGQADFLMLVTLDDEKEVIHTLQIDRDTMSTIRIYGPFGDYTGQNVAQLCLSHAYGTTAEANCENVVWAVSNFLGGIPISAYIRLDMDSMELINDALGGITVTLTDDFSHLDPQMTAGRTLRLQGKQTEHYLRSRIGVGAGTNESRMQRQRLYLDEAIRTFINQVNKDLNFVGQLYDDLDGHMLTNADRGWLINTVYNASQYDTRKMLTIAGEHRLSDRGFMEFRADGEALEELLIRTYFEKLD